MEEDLQSPNQSKVNWTKLGPLALSHRVPADAVLVHDDLVPPPAPARPQALHVTHLWSDAAGNKRSSLCSMKWERWQQKEATVRSIQSPNLSPLMLCRRLKLCFTYTAVSSWWWAPSAGPIEHGGTAFRGSRQQATTTIVRPTQQQLRPCTFKEQVKREDQRCLILLYVPLNGD